jgi:putative endonuclease
MSNTVTVYIITDKPYGTLYIGQTNNLARRMFEHKNGLIEGFSKQYNLKSLVYYERYENPTEGFARERALKKWNRDWKINLIHEMNRDWRDLSEEIN